MDDKTIYCFIIISLLIVLLFFVLKKSKETFTFDPYNGRNPNGPPLCCGNLDWYLGDKYKAYCGNVKPTAFQNTRTVEAFEIDTEMVAKDAQVGHTEYTKLDNECKAEDESWKGAFNPMICTEGRKVISEANCKCMNRRNECVKCYDKIDLSKYLG